MTPSIKILPDSFDSECNTKCKTRFYWLNTCLTFYNCVTYHAYHKYDCHHNFDMRGIIIKFFSALWKLKNNTHTYHTQIDNKKYSIDCLILENV